MRYIFRHRRLVSDLFPYFHFFFFLPLWEKDDYDSIRSQRARESTAFTVLLFFFFFFFPFKPQRFSFYSMSFLISFFISLSPCDASSLFRGKRFCRLCRRAFFSSGYLRGFLHFIFAFSCFYLSVTFISFF